MYQIFSSHLYNHFDLRGNEINPIKPNRDPGGRERDNFEFHVSKVITKERCNTWQIVVITTLQSKKRNNLLIIKVIAWSASD